MTLKDIMWLLDVACLDVGRGHGLGFVVGAIHTRNRHFLQKRACHLDYNFINNNINRSLL